MIRDVLAAAQAGPRPQARRAGVLVAGVIGRIGEALLNRVLSEESAAPGGRDVVALADSPMALGLRGLVLAAQDALPPLEAAYVVLSEPGEEAQRSFYGRDAPFVQVDRYNCLHVAQRAVAAGARRLVLVSPMPAWQQVGRFHTGLADGTELEIARLPLESLAVLRPVRTGGRAAASFVERLVNLYLSVQLLMLPRSIDVITSEKLARCAVAAMRAAGPGVSVYPADRIPGLLELREPPVQCAP